MKKLSARTVLFTLLVLASIASYTFLNSVSGEPYAATGLKDIQIQQELPKLEEGKLEQEEVSFPGVTILKGALQMGKRILPSQ